MQACTCSCMVEAVPGDLFWPADMRMAATLRQLQSVRGHPSAPFCRFGPPAQLIPAAQCCAWALQASTAPCANFKSRSTLSWARRGRPPQRTAPAYSWSRWASRGCWGVHRNAAAVLVQFPTTAFSIHASQAALPLSPCCVWVRADQPPPAHLGVPAAGAARRVHVLRAEVRSSTCDCMQAWTGWGAFVLRRAWPCTRCGEAFV